MALAGMNRCPDIGGAAPAGVPIPGAGLGGSCVPGGGLARVPGMASVPGLDRRRCPAWIMVEQALSALCFLPLAG
jgi:hypothetical protein